MAAIPTITAEQLDPRSRAGVVLLDLWQQTCPPYGALESRLERFALRHPHQLAAYRIDIDKDTPTPRRFEIMSIPTRILFCDGHEGAPPTG